MVCGLLCGCGGGPVGAPQGSCAALEILVGFGIGGGTDTFARHLAAPLSETAGVPVHVVNITAGSGIAAYRELESRPANGCTLLAITSDYEILSLYEPETVDISGLRLIARAHTEIGLLLRAAGAEPWPQLVRRVAGEDRSLLVGGVGARSFDRAAIGISLSDQAPRFRYIPYGGAKEMQADLLGGRLDAMYEEFGVVKGLIDSGLVEPLLVIADERLEVLADAPSAPEYGLAVAPPIWRGIAIHRDVPSARAGELMTAVNEALTSRDYRQYERDRFLHVADGYIGDSSAFAATVKRELELFRAAMALR